ncbi:DUF1678 family protein [Methanopyrus sp. KOL6]|uniref:DUF1678 family protein n=1 Tax=Methanopyrus sp. KOL6 TaxID=1937004 RepID=UPI000B4B4240|nr:DUF1678 family protein [Methanopyrus sp. KOL6]
MAGSPTARPDATPVRAPERIRVPKPPRDPVEQARVLRVLLETVRRGVLPFLGASYRSVNGKVYGPYYEARWKPRKGERGRTIYLGKSENESVRFLEAWLWEVRRAAPRLTEHRKAKWFVARAVRRALAALLTRFEGDLEEALGLAGEILRKVGRILTGTPFDPLRTYSRPRGGRELLKMLLGRSTGEFRDVLLEMLSPWPPWYCLTLLERLQGRTAAREYHRARVPRPGPAV